METSTEDGFERFVDGRSQGLGAMLGAGAQHLGMSFELERSLEVLKEFGLSGLAGANMSSPRELLEDPAFRQLLQENDTARELILYLGGAKLKARLQGVLR